MTGVEQDTRNQEARNDEKQIDARPAQVTAGIAISHRNVDMKQQDRKNRNATQAIQNGDPRVDHSREMVGAGSRLVRGVLGPRQIGFVFHGLSGGSQKVTTITP